MVQRFDRFLVMLPQRYSNSSEKLNIRKRKNASSLWNIRPVRSNDDFSAMNFCRYPGQ